MATYIKILKDKDGNLVLPRTSTTAITMSDQVTLVEDAINGKIAKTTLTTTGDLMYASSANTPNRLAIGANGYYLTSNGTTPQWTALSMPSGLTAGSASIGFINYAGTTKTLGQWDGGTVAPSNTTRLNYDGYLYATRFYGDGSQLTNLTIPSGLTSGSTSTGFVNYNGTTQADGQWDGGTSAPNATTRLNYDGYLYATRFYGDGSQLTGITIPSGLTSGSTSTGFINYNGTTAAAGQWDGGTTAPTGTNRINYGGYLYATRVYNAYYNDYAEFFEKGEELEPGDVISKKKGETKYIKSTHSYDNMVVGVYSDSYGHCLGGTGADSEENFIPVGLAGRVDVKVCGKIEEGDLLVASFYQGVAMKADKYIPGTVIGKALENHNSADFGKIKMLIMNI